MKWDTYSIYEHTYLQFLRSAYTKYKILHWNTLKLRGIFSVGFYMLGKLFRGTNLNDSSDCWHFGQLSWPSSGQIVNKLVRVLSIYGHAQKVIKCQERHKPCALAWTQSAALCLGLTVPWLSVFWVINWARRPKELQLKDALHNQTATEELLNWDVGLEVPGCWLTTLKKGTVRLRQSGVDCHQARACGNLWHSWHFKLTVPILASLLFALKKARAAGQNIGNH